MSKLCHNCSGDNDDSAIVCTTCNAELSNAQVCGASDLESADAVQKPASKPVLIMTDLKSRKVITISENCIIGREGNVEPEFFAGNMLVSRVHCRIVADNGGFKIEHLSDVNPTMINNDELPKRISRVIRNNDFLTIANMTFEITIDPGEVPDDTATAAVTPQNNDLPDGKTRYIITCPKCGAEHEVPDINAKIPECSECSDYYDKYEIANIGAIEVTHAN